MTGPLVLGHRGASGYRPELTEEALRLAVAQGADGVEIDVVPSRDGHLVLRHDAALAATTDAAERLESDARTDGLDWPALAALRARERFPDLRAGSAAFDDRLPLLRLPDAVRIAEELDTLLVVEIKEPLAFARAGLDPVPLVARDLAGARCRVALESFEKHALDALAPLGLPAVVLVDDAGTAPGEAARGGSTDADEIADPASLARFDGVSVATTLVTPALVDACHRAGLAVWTWTLRPENRFLPPDRRLGEDPAALGDWRGAWSALLDAGVDAVFVDHPDLAVAARDGADGSVRGPEGAPSAHERRRAPDGR